MVNFCKHFPTKTEIAPKNYTSSLYGICSIFNKNQPNFFYPDIKNVDGFLDHLNGLCLKFIFELPPTVRFKSSGNLESLWVLHLRLSVFSKNDVFNKNHEIDEIKIHDI